jgi:hypothetical protein
MIDLYDEESQREWKSGPVPAGSKVLLKIVLVKPKYAAWNNEFIAVTKSGFRQLWVKLEVAAGEYEGVFWHENISLPEGEQDISLSDGQRTACRIGGACIKAIVQAARGISPTDKNDSARRQMNLADWRDLNGMEFPARVGIDDTPYTNKDGLECWSNRLGTVITPNKAEYDELMNGGEIITDGPVTENGTSRRSNGNSNDGSDGIPDRGDPPTDSYMNDIPF